MGARKGDVTFIPSEGWVRRKGSEISTYENLGSGWPLMIAFMRLFPDFVLDLFRSEHSDYGAETLLQRVIMRAKARYQYVDITGCRGLTKTSTTLKEELCEQLLFPGIKASYYGPSYKQMAKIASSTFRQLEHDYPALAGHFTVGAESVDRFEVSTLEGSSMSIAAFRGDNVHKVVAEEYAQEDGVPFDIAEYKRVVLPAIRLSYNVEGRPSPAFVKYKQHSITSAGRRQNPAYDTREQHLRMMRRGESAFVMDVPYDAVLLMGMRPVAWAENLRMQLTPDEWAREMESIYSGADTNPVISDGALTDSRSLVMMEEHHCCKDRANKLKPDDVIYVIGYDVSYADGSKNAKCAAVVVKLTKQTEWLKRDRYLKQVVYVNDMPPRTSAEQARMLKRLWYSFSYPESSTYIAIDAWQYGTSVLQALMMDLDDGLPPLCVYNHALYTEYELDGAVPVIYPVKAGGVGTTDPDAEMIRNIELQFEHRNIQLLTRDYEQGLETYKKYHRIKTESMDYIIYNAYKKTNELCSQIQNLKKVPNGAGVSEKRISKAIQRDSWSALKYAVRFAQVLERTRLAVVHKKSDWYDAIAAYGEGTGTEGGTAAGRLRYGMAVRHGGRLY